MSSASSSHNGRRNFHTFDALRFLACFKVFLQHLPIVAFPWFNYLRAGGGIGVHFFFVLSGFLITYIIFEEKERSGRLDLRNFFARRILRIWPLYFLMVGVAYTLPWLLSGLGMTATQNGYEPKLWMSVLFLENYRSIGTGQIAGVSPLYVMWSLCVEEHFYIVWALLSYRLLLKRLPWLIGACLLLGPVSRAVFLQQGWLQYDLFTNIDLFAWGAVPAWLLLSRGKKTEDAAERFPLWLKQGYALALVALVLCIAQINSEAVNVWAASLFGLSFALLLWWTLPAHTRFCIPDGHVLSRWGRYTYGLYLYHTLVMVAMVKLFGVLGWSQDEPVGAVVFAVVAFACSLLLSMASYHWLERPFLKLKRYFR